MQRQLSTAKKRTNVTINAGLFDEAKESGINLSALLEAALQEKLKQSRRERYLKENQAAFASHNAFIEKAGLFSDDEGVI
ncbi:acetoacetyl-CoA synthase (plasmid) [Lelliottia sp. WB101]|jgi:antitoxin CcdA|uniref:type II toxin-antitoxin system CcdA family antitoxin n=1 Tax=Lelliottia sp. WB101 TaxID=2153385 RepID=UPI000D200DBC|nr:type II toxin-antitoxin system CcdA family antitoxin [Lelliottia sp. WB101]AVZ00376.1 acetoacetyl-CoA synthase [Lelliottia sp. WB101]